MERILTIDDLDALEGPHYVLVCGGFGVGKTYVTGRHIKSIPIMDIDEVMLELKLTDYDSPDYAKAYEVIAERISGMMERRESLVAMGTSSNITTAIDRLFTAKTMGYNTVLLYIEAPTEQAIRQNRHRRDVGERGLRREEEYKIERSNIGAATTFAHLKDSKLVDHYVHHNNWVRQSQIAVIEDA